MPRPLSHRALLGFFMVACSGATTPRSPGEATPRSGALLTLPAMGAPRAAHTATTLQDGRVLVVGGLSSGSLAAAELFDPTTRRFIATGALHAARAGHTATLLPDGRVLVAGGLNDAYLSSSEIYDPARGTFAPGPEMLEPRSDHLAITLADGRILFVGGTSTGFTFLASAELFDPATMQFSRTGSMLAARESHVGVLLPTGSVLIAGGHAGRGANLRLYDAAELYDPMEGRFRATGAMTRRRHKHAGIMLPDGRALITGGADERDDRGTYNDAEVFDARTERFTPIGVMQRTRYKHQGSMTLLRDGRIFIAGGAGDPEVFDVANMRFSLVPSSNVLPGSFSAVAVLADGSVLITGGYGGGTGPRNAAWLYAP